MIYNSESETDGNKLRMVADWFDIMQDGDRFPEWSPSREVQEELRRMARRLDLLKRMENGE